MPLGSTGHPLVTGMKNLVLALSLVSALRVHDYESYQSSSSILQMSGKKVQSHETTSKFESFVYDLAEKAVAGNLTMDDTTKEAIDVIKAYFETLNNHSLEQHAADQENVDAAYDAIAGCTSDTQTTRTDAEGLLGTAGTDRNEHNKCRERQVIADDNKTTLCAFYWNYRNTDTVKTALSCQWSTATEECLRDSFPTLQELHRLYKQCEAMGGFSDAPVPDEGQSFNNMIDTRNLAAACDSAQLKFETSFCSYATKADDGCTQETSCREREIAARNRLHARVQVSEEGRKVDSSVSARIECLLTIFDLEASKKSDKFLACKAAVVNNSMFNINYHGIPPASFGGVPCSAVTAPCADEWVANEYPPQPWYADVKPATCTECTQPQPVCCMAMEASCLACKAGVPVEEYCQQHPGVDGCGDANINWQTVFTEEVGAGTGVGLESAKQRLLDYDITGATNGNYWVRMEWQSSYIQFKVPPGFNIFEQAENLNIPITDVTVDGFESPNIGSDALFCHACFRGNPNKWGDTCWAVTPVNDHNRGCGCNSGSWTGSGVYYGGMKAANRCTGWGGGFAGPKVSGQSKGGHKSLGVVLKVGF